MRIKSIFIANLIFIATLSTSFLKEGCRAQDFLNFGTLNWPAGNRVVTGSLAEIRHTQGSSSYHLHGGIDIAASYNDPVLYTGPTRYIDNGQYIRYLVIVKESTPYRVTIRRAVDSKSEDFNEWLDGTGDAWCSYRYLHVSGQNNSTTMILNIDDALVTDENLTAHAPDELRPGYEKYPVHLPIAYIQDYDPNHLHFETIHYANGFDEYWSGYYKLNPLNFLSPQYSDNTSPVIQEVLLFNHATNEQITTGSGTESNPFIIPPDVTSLAIRLKAYDLTASNNRLGLFYTGWSVRYTYGTEEEALYDFHFFDEMNGGNTDVGTETVSEGTDFIYDVANSWHSPSPAQYCYWITNIYDPISSGSVHTIPVTKLAPIRLKLHVIAGQWWYLNNWTDNDLDVEDIYFQRSSQTDDLNPIISKIYVAYEEDEDETDLNTNVLNRNKSYDIIIDAHDNFRDGNGNTQKCNPKLIRFRSYKEGDAQPNWTEVPLSPLTKSASEDSFRYANGSGTGFLYIISNTDSDFDEEMGNNTFSVSSYSEGDRIKLEVQVVDWSGRESVIVEKTFEVGETDNRRPTITKCWLAFEEDNQERPVQLYDSGLDTGYPSRDIYLAPSGRLDIIVETYDEKPQDGVIVKCPPDTIIVKYYQTNKWGSGPESSFLKKTIKMVTPSITDSSFFAEGHSPSSNIYRYIVSNINENGYVDDSTSYVLTNPMIEGFYCDEVGIYVKDAMNNQSYSRLAFRRPDNDWPPSQYDYTHGGPYLHEVVFIREDDNDNEHESAMISLGSKSNYPIYNFAQQYDIVAVAYSIQHCWKSEDGDLLKYDTREVKKIEYKIWESTVKPEAFIIALDSTTTYDPAKLNIYYASLKNCPFSSKFQYIITNNNAGNDNGTYHPNDTTKYDTKNGHLAATILRITDWGNKSKIFEDKDKCYFWIAKEHTNWNSTWKPEVDEPTPIPEDFHISQNFPNPFNPQTTIQFEVPDYVQVKLTIHNLMGQSIKTLVNGKLEPGTHTVIWDGTNENGEKVSSGLYFYRLSTPEFNEVKKLVLVK